MINYLFVVSRQGKTRLSKWYATTPAAARARVVKDVTQIVLSRKVGMCNVVEYKGKKVIYRRYASLFFIAEIGDRDNELVTLEVIHRYVELLDKFFGNVCELDLGRYSRFDALMLRRIYNFQQAYHILDELLISGEMADPSLNAVLKLSRGAETFESEENMKAALEAAAMI